ncbi:hypothetical protein CsatB_018566 [Cannabis sativa]
MAQQFPPWILTFIFINLSLTVLSFSPQNIETTYPYPNPSPPTSSPLPSKPPSSNSPTQLPTPVEPAATTGPSTSSKGKIAKVVAATAVSTVVVTAAALFFVQRYMVAKRKRENGAGAVTVAGAAAGGGGGGGGPVVQTIGRSEFVRYDGGFKGFIVDENGLDVLYWRKLEMKNNNNNNNNNSKENGNDDNRRRRRNEAVQEIPLLRGRSSSSHVVKVVVPVEEEEPETRSSSSSSSAPPPSAPPTPPPPPPPPPKNTPAPAPPPPPPPKRHNLHSVAKPPLGSKGGKEEATMSTTAPVKLKPLHWDKVNTNAEHSMVWDKVNDNGSFRFDGDLMEALFGCVATNRKSPKGNEAPKAINAPPPQVFILDNRKSQNIAIILKSLYISRREIIDSLMDGHGLNAETLEKLSRIAPTEEEQSKILEFHGDPTRLADAESFLFHILKVVPSAFTRIDAMSFRSNYSFEILQLKESIRTLDSACKELRTRGLFMKLLEAILKAGNRMNAGTSRGNAQAFNLNSLRKLSDVRSTDGKTTLLHFVVEEVVRSEGKRCVLNRNRSTSRSYSRQSSNSSSSSSSSKTTSLASHEKEKEYVMLGLPVVGGLSSEFSNVKKAAAIDYDTFSTTSSAVLKRAEDVRKLIVSQSIKGGFAREMETFLDAAEEEVKVVEREQLRVMELVRKTTEYYQAGTSKEKGAHPFQLFVIVKDFLVMVDLVCVEIARDLQKKKKRVAAESPRSTQLSSMISTTTSPSAHVNRPTVKFPNLPDNFMSDKSSDSDDD